MFPSASVTHIRAEKRRASRKAQDRVGHQRSLGKAAAETRTGQPRWGAAGNSGKAYQRAQQLEPPAFSRAHPRRAIRRQPHSQAYPAGGSLGLLTPVTKITTSAA